MSRQTEPPHKEYSTLKYGATLSSTFPETVFYQIDYAEKLSFLAEYNPVYLIIWYQSHELLLSFSEQISNRNSQLSTFVQDGKILFDHNFDTFKNFHEKYCYALKDIVDNALALNQMCYGNLTHYGKMHFPFKRKALLNQLVSDYEHLMPDEKVFAGWKEIFSKIKSKEKSRYTQMNSES